MNPALWPRPGEPRTGRWRVVGLRICALLIAGLCSAAAALANGLPPAYTPLIIQPQGRPERAEFDLGPALVRAQKENKRLYVYLGAEDCPYCRRYEAFLARNADTLLPHFKDWLIVDLRSTLATTARQLHLRVGTQSLPYLDFQRAIADERTRMLVYPSVWLFDVPPAAPLNALPRPLMQMPAGTGTFETVEEQLEILQLVQ